MSGFGSGLMQDLTPSLGFCVVRWDGNLCDDFWVVRVVE